MKTPEMKYRGSVTNCSVGCAESALPMKAEIANARQTNVNAPRTLAIATAKLRARNGTPNATLPNHEDRRSQYAHGLRIP